MSLRQDSCSSFGLLNSMVRTLILFLLLLLPAMGQTVKQTNPPIPASLSVLAGDGDNTYCVATAVKTPVSFTLTCRRSGVTKFTSTVIVETAWIVDGDLCWLFNYDATNPKLVHFQVSETVRVKGVITGTKMKSQGDVLWP